MNEEPRKLIRIKSNRPEAVPGEIEALLAKWSKGRGASRRGGVVYVPEGIEIEIEESE